MACAHATGNAIAQCVYSHSSSVLGNVHDEIRDAVLIMVHNNYSNRGGIWIISFFSVRSQATSAIQSHTRKHSNTHTHTRTRTHTRTHAHTHTHARARARASRALDAVIWRRVDKTNMATCNVCTMLQSFEVQMLSSGTYPAIYSVSCQLVAVTAWMH